MAAASGTKATHAGGIVYKEDGETVDYLLVRPKRAPKEWVFAKGRIEKGESAEEAAVREVEEETGVVARSIAPVGFVEFEVNGSLCVCNFS